MTAKGKGQIVATASVPAGHVGAAAELARALGPGAVVYALEADWRAFWVASGRPRLTAPDRAFLGWLRGRGALSEADVVVADRLAPRELLSELAPDVEAGRFIELPGRAGILYVGEIDAEGSRFGRMFVQSEREGRLDVVTAREGELILEGELGRYLLLRDGFRVEGDSGQRDFRMMRYAENELKVPDREPESAAELAFEGALRPQSLGEFVGQHKVRRQLQLLLEAAGLAAARRMPGSRR